MRLQAMAKVNLALDVLGKRPDGYHDVRMIMQSIAMYDVLEMTPVKEPGIRITTNLSYIPVNDRNLAWRAADLMIREFDITDGIRISLKKVIPVAAGMGGGSADAAAALVGMNRLFSLGLGEKDLMAYAAKLGADVPFCVMRGTALAEGIGEKLTPLPPMPECAVLIGKPGISVSTKAAYESLNVAGIGEHPDIDGMIEAVRQKDMEGILSRMQNVFSPGIEEQFPVVRQIRELMEANGAMRAMMSGSGPTVFGIFSSQAGAEAAAETLRNSGLARVVHVTRTFRKGHDR